MFSNEILIVSYGSAAELPNKSEELLGVKINTTAISEVYNGKNRNFKGFEIRFHEN